MDNIENVTIPFDLYLTFYIAGASNSGKTYFVYKLMKYAKQLFPRDPPKDILYCYSVHQELYDVMEKEIDNVRFIQGMPSKSDIMSISSIDSHSMLILDDMIHLAASSQLIEDIFLINSHHNKITCALISHNMFNNYSKNRNIVLNCQYTVIMRNPRAFSQISHLGTQMFGKGKAQILYQIYTDIMESSSHGYLIIDLTKNIDSRFKLRTRIFPSEDPIVYVINT